MATAPTSLNYGGYDVTPDWNFSKWQQDNGQIYTTFYNPNDTKSNFTTQNSPNSLMEFVTQNSRVAETNPNQVSDLFTQGTNGLYTGTSNLYGGGKTIEQLDEQKRLDALAAQVSSGAITREAGNTQANSLTPLVSEAQDQAMLDQVTYEEPVQQRGIQSELINGERYQIGSKAWNEAKNGKGEVAGATTEQQQGAQQTLPTFTRNLSVGSQGDDVIQLQRALGITSDGIFGPKTQAAVRAFQQSKGLQVDGIVGPRTTAALFGTPQGGNTAGAIAGLTSGSQGSGSQSAPQEQAVQKIEQTNPVKDILKEFGIDLENKSPQSSFSDIYKQVYKDLGLDTVKTQIASTSKDLEKLQNEKNDERLKINNDPWLSEGVRVSQLRKLDEKYEGRESNLLSRIQIMESQYDNARQDAQFLAGNIYSQAEAKQALQQDLIFKAIDIAENRVEAEQKLILELAKNQGTDKLLSPTEAATLGVPYGTTESQAAGMGITPSKYNDQLTPTQINSSVNAIAGAFDNEPIVKAYNTVQEGFQTINSIGVNTSSPADDIAFIYAFAKIMDPNSVVREGEYNTIQKYAQTWADNFNFSAKRIFSNTNFLTADAKQKMLNALSPKVQTITGQYNNLYSEYQRQVNDAYGGAPRQITNYAGGTTGPVTSGWDF